MTSKETVGTWLAVSAATLFSLACQKSDEPDPGSAGAAAAAMPKPGPDQVHCLGVHECKGKSDCHIAGGHACAGQNECKGKGWIALTRAECEQRGGKIIDG